MEPPNVAAFTAGLRLALILLAVMSLSAIRKHGRDETLYDREKRLAWQAVALAVIVYSPVHALWLMGRGLGRPVSVWFDALGSGLACLAFIRLLAARGLRSGFTLQRVRRGTAVNVAITLAMVGAAWIFR